MDPMAFRKLAIVLTAAMMLCMGFISLAPSASASPGDLHVFSPTVTAMEVEMDSSVTYRWGVFNNGTTPHTLLIDVHGTELGWDARLSNEDAYFLVGPGEFVSIDLNVTAPNTRDYPEDIITLNATARDLVTQEMWTEDLGTVTTTIVGGWTMNGVFSYPRSFSGLFWEPSFISF
jgi:hypothetical protein